MLLGNKYGIGRKRGRPRMFLSVPFFTIPTAYIVANTKQHTISLFSFFFRARFCSQNRASPSSNGFHKQNPCSLVPLRYTFMSPSRPFLTFLPFLRMD